MLMHKVFGAALALSRCRLLSMLIALLVLFGASAVPTSAVAQVAFTEVGPALLPDGTSYGMRVPQNWNGVVLNDLDYVGARNGARSQYFMSKGYAIAGIQRHPNRRYQLDPAGEVANLLTVLDIFEAQYGKPKRVISFGTSAGGQLGMAFAEAHPDRINGVVVGAATTPVWTSGVRFDTYFIAKQLLAPNDPLLGFLGLPDNSAPYVARWQQVFTQAAQTPAGRARLALAFTMAQWNTWGVGLPRPDPTDLTAFQNHIVALAARLHQPHVNTQFLFETQVGVWMGNDGADYARYWQNGDPAYKHAVRELYQAAGLDLDAEIEIVNSAPRAVTNKQAAAFWMAHPARTQRGNPLVPVFRMHTLGDPQVVISQMQVYNDQVKRNGKQPLYRDAYVEREGHVNFTVSEYAAAVEVMMQRLDSADAARKGGSKGNLDTGQWPDTSPEALNALAQMLRPGTESRFIQHHLRHFNGEWRLDY
jgi:pimeloyl-ACP methyl ester carboxylesterase